MVDVAEHPVVAFTRDFAASPDPGVERQLLAILGDTRQAAADLGHLAATHVVDDSNRPLILHGLGRLLQTQVALWQSLVHVPSSRSQYGTVRTALGETMDELREVIEVVAFKADPDLSAELQRRIESVADTSSGAGGDWRSVLADL